MATMTAEISKMRLDIGDIQEALKNHDSDLEGMNHEGFSRFKWKMTYLDDL